MDFKWATHDHRLVAANDAQDVCAYPRNRTQMPAFLPLCAQTRGKVPLRVNPVPVLWRDPYAAVDVGLLDNNIICCGRSGLILGHSGLAQASEEGCLEQGADLYYAPIP